jgi:hypothetical protein
MGRKRGDRLGTQMIQRDNAETDQDFLNERQQFVFKGAALLLCAAILALVLLSGRHETRIADQCNQAGTRDACPAGSSAVSPRPPIKGALAPLGTGSTQPGGN